MNKLRGFTLIELMIVVAVIAILASIAIPAYNDSVAKAKRADAQTVLLSFASAMERYFTENNTYCDAGGAGGANSCGAAGSNDTGTPSIIGATVPLDGGSAYYNLTISTITPSSYTLTASRTGSMASDKCGNLTVTNTGVQGITKLDGTGSFTGSNANDAGKTAQGNCWR